MISRSRVAVTVSREALAGLEGLLASHGTDLHWTPLQTFEPPEDWGEVDGAMARMERYGAIALTSPRAAKAFVERMAATDAAPSVLPHVWAGGDATARAWAPMGPATVAPTDANYGAGTVVARAILDAGVRGAVLYPSGDHRRPELPDALREAGLEVDAVTCYRSILASPEVAEAALAGVDAVVVGSPRVAKLLAGVRRPPWVRLIALGPTTARAAEQEGWPAAAVSERPTAPAVIRAILGGSTPMTGPPSTPPSRSS